MNSEKFRHLFDLTIKNIKRRKLRSILTILSITIGIASIIALILISDGLFNAVESQFDKMGANSIYVVPITYGGGRTGSDFSGMSGTQRLTEDISLKMSDSKLIEKIPEIDYVVPFSFNISRIEYNDEEVYKIVLIAPEDKADLAFESFQMNFEDGESMGDKGGKKVVIGPYLSKELFDKKIDVNDRIEINGYDFRVTGILEPIGNSEDDSSAYITREVAKEVFGLDNQVDQIIAKVKPNIEISVAKEKIEKTLEKEYDEENFTVITSKQILDIIKSLLQVLKLLLTSIAAISIVVGSIGIMNSIYTSVMERTKEIGILKSIGAKISDITFIFILESMILSVIGGIIGLLFGIFIAKAVEYYAILNNFDILHIVVTPTIVVLAIFLSILIGFFAGIFPAKKAARKNPVDALKNIF